MTPPHRQRLRRDGRRPRIVVCGGGVAAIEALLGLRALLGLAPQIDLIAPNRRFVYEPLAVAEPFGLAHTRRFDLAAVAAEYRAQLHVASLARVEPRRRRIGVSDGAAIAYDSLIVAVGARRSAWLPEALQFGGAADVSPFRELLARLERGAISSLAFAAPAGSSWTLPTYELVLLTASWVADRHLTGIELTIVTPEEEPLASFGATAGRAMRDVLADRGIRLRVNARADQVLPGGLRLADGDAFEVDEVVAVPKLEGPHLAGLAADDAGFIEIDDHARVAGLDDVYAAGDATAFPIKQGGIATQQADVAVETIAARLGAGVEPSAFQPVLRGMLLTGVAPTYLRAAVAGDPTEQGELAVDPLWWPPTKIAGRYLGPYLAATEPPRGDAGRGQRLAADGDRGSTRTGHRAADAGQREADGGHREADAGHREADAGHRETGAGHRQARELALRFALADANSEDYRSALRWLEVVEHLDGTLPPGYDEKRVEWRARDEGGHRSSHELCGQTQNLCPN